VRREETGFAASRLLMTHARILHEEKPGFAASRLLMTHARILRESMKKSWVSPPAVF
jgi:hypothetical protein